MSETVVQIGLTLLCTLLASSGLWAIIQKKMDKMKTDDKLLLQMAQQMILDKGIHFSNRGWLTDDEYACLKILYKAYSDKGGNGLATRVMVSVDKLPIRQTTEMADIIDKQGAQGLQGVDVDLVSGQKKAKAADKKNGNGFAAWL